MAIFRQRGELQYTKFDYLLRGPRVMGVDNPIGDWVHDSVWGSVQVRFIFQEKYKLCCLNLLVSQHLSILSILSLGT